MARINQSIDAANEQAKQGSLGFINWMLEQSNLTEQQTTDLTRAKKVIETLLQKASTSTPTGTEPLLCRQSATTWLP